MRNPANLGAVVDWKFPGKGEDGGYEIRQDGEGQEPYISRWNESIMGRPQPTPEEIDGWELPAAKQQRRRAIKRDAELEYDAIFEQDGEQLDMFKDRLLVKLGRQLALTQGETNARNRMTAVQDKMEAKLQQVRDAATIDEVSAITW